MRPVARGALMLSLLPRQPEVVTPRELVAIMAALGVHIGLRTVQRDLESLPASLVVRTNGIVKPGKWARR